MPHMTVSESSPMQCQSAEVPLVQGDILMSSMFSGIGHADLALKDHGFKPVVYADTDEKASTAYAHAFPTVPQFEDVTDLDNAPQYIIDAFKSVDVCFVGAPCADHSSLNAHRDPLSKQSLLIYEGLAHMQKYNTKVGVYEVIPDFMTLMGGQLAADFCVKASPYTYGSAQ